MNPPAAKAVPPARRLVAGALVLMLGCSWGTRAQAQTPAMVEPSPPDLVGTKPLHIPLRIVDGRIMILCEIMNVVGRVENFALELALDSPETLVLNANYHRWLGLDARRPYREQPGARREPYIRFSFGSDSRAMLDAREVGQEPDDPPSKQALRRNWTTRYYARQLDEHRVAGSMGLGFLRRFAHVALDIPRGELVLTPHPDSVPDSVLEAHGDTVVQFTGDDNIRLPVSFGGNRRGHLILGSSGYDTCIDPALAESLGKPYGDIGPTLLQGEWALDLSEFVAFRPAPVPFDQDDDPSNDGAVLVTGVNWLEHFRIELDWTRSRAAFTAKHPAKYPEQDFAYFRIERDGTAGDFLSYLERYPNVRLSPEAAHKLMNLRLAEGADDTAMLEALQWIADTALPERRMEECLVYANHLRGIPGRADATIEAAKLALKYSREAITVQDVYRLQKILGEQYLRRGELEPAWSNLLSAALVPLTNERAPAERDVIHDLEVNLNLARVYEIQGRFNRAYARYKKALDVVLRVNYELPESWSMEIQQAMDRLRPSIAEKDLELLDGRSEDFSSIAGKPDSRGGRTGDPTRGRVISVPPVNVAAVLAQRLDAKNIDAIYRRAIAEEGSPESLIRRLSAWSRDESRSQQFRVNASWLASHVQWRHGWTSDAIRSADAALKLQTTGELLFHRGQLAEAAGDVDGARRLYGQVLERLEGRLAEEARLRLVFLDANNVHDIEALLELAKSRDQAFRNRAAVALSILGYNEQALSLYSIGGEPGTRFREHLQLAQWALGAGDPVRAQAEAAAAVDLATLERERRYALSVLVDAHGIDDSLDRLLAHFARKTSLTPEEQQVRIEVLRRTGRFQEAIELFRKQNPGELDIEAQLQLLRMYSAAGQRKEIVAEYEKLIARDPAETGWVMGLSELYLENGEPEKAQMVWQAFIDRNTSRAALLAAAAALTKLRMHELALAATEKCLEHAPEAAAQVRLVQFEMYLKRGLQREAQAILDALDEQLPHDASLRTELADGYERIGKPAQALRVWIAYGRHKRGGLTLDERMRIAWLHDVVGDRQASLEVWKSLWSGDIAETRRRLIEDRLLLAAAQAGQISPIAVELESKLAARTASARDATLLIRIYQDAGDLGSVIEVIQEYFGADGRSIESLKEQAKVYRAMGDAGAYRVTIMKLLEADPDNRIDYLQSLLLSHIETNRPRLSGPGRAAGRRTDPAIEHELELYLGELERLSDGADDEFRAGVLKLAGLNDKALDTYRRSLAARPTHYDNYLLMADLLRELGAPDQAAATLQYLAETAPGDEAFMVAIDGLLNLNSPVTEIYRWAQRRVLERITRHSDKVYLYELSAELAEQTRNATVYFSSLENSLVHANARRSAILRELMRATAQRSVSMQRGFSVPDPERNLMYGRRLIALGEALPPEIYMDMGRNFLAMKDPMNALQAFNRVIEETGRPSVVEETAALFQKEGFNEQAIALYEKALIANPDSINAMYRLGQLRSRQGRTAQANELFLRALLTLVQSQPMEVDRPRSPGRKPTLEANVTYQFRESYPGLRAGFLETLPRMARGGAQAEVAERLQTLQAAFDREIAQVVGGQTGITKELACYPRLNALARLLREATTSIERPDLLQEVDETLTQYFGHGVEGA